MIITAVISIEYYRGDIMDEQFIRDRLSFLRTQKGISEYKMSLDLGHSKSYIQSISNGRALPSLSEFLLHIVGNTGRAGRRKRTARVRRMTIRSI